MARMYYDADANLDLLNGKTVAIIGYGSRAMPMPSTSKTVGLTSLSAYMPEVSPQPKPKQKV